MSSRYHMSRAGMSAGHALRSQKLRHLSTFEKTPGPLDCVSTTASEAEPVREHVSKSRIQEVGSVPHPRQHGPHDLQQIFAVRFNPNAHRGENYCAVGYADGALRVFQGGLPWTKELVYPLDFDTPDAEESKLLARGIPVQPAFQGEPKDPITSVQWLDAKRVLFLQGSQIHVLNNEEPKSGVTTVKHDHGAMYVSDVSSTGTDLGSCKRPQRFLVAGTERKAVLYDARTLQETCCLKKSLYRPDSFAHSNRIAAAKFFPDCDGQVYVTASWDNSVAVWDTRSGRRERWIEEDLSFVGCGPEALDVDRNMIMTASYRTNSPVQLFDFGTCRLVENVSLAKDFMPYSCKFTRDHKRILVGGKFVNSTNQGSFACIRRSSPKCILTYENHALDSAVWSVDAYQCEQTRVDGAGMEFALGHSDGSLSILRS